MLKQRLITGLIFALSVIALIVLAPAWFVAAAFAVLVMAAAYEWAALAGFTATSDKFIYSILIGAALGFTWWLLQPLSRVDLPGVAVTLQLAALAWLLGIMAILLYPRGRALWGGRAVLAGIGFLVLVPPWVALVYLRSLAHGEYLVIFAIAMIAMADIGAYFSGRAFGGPKLMPQVSPGKTWSGFCGGMALSCCFALLAGSLSGLSGRQLLLWVAVAAVSALMSVFGDLLESMVKRNSGLKDSGSLLPGHGGLFDRLDSLSAGLPVFALGMLLCGAFWP